MTIGKAVLDRDISTRNKADLFQPLLNGEYPRGFRILSLTMEHADQLHRRLLRPRYNRPSRGASQERDEFAPFHLINSLVNQAAGSQCLCSQLFFLATTRVRSEPTAGEFISTRSPGFRNRSGAELPSGNNSLESAAVPAAVPPLMMSPG